MRTALRSQPAVVPARKAPQTCGGNHRRIVGRERETRNEHRQLAQPHLVRARPHAGDCWPTRLRRYRHCARHTTAPPRTVDRAASRRRRAGSSRRCREFPDRAAGSSSPSPSACAPRRDVSQHRGLQAAEAEIAPAGQLGRVAIGVRQPRFRKAAPRGRCLRRPGDR